MFDTLKELIASTSDDGMKVIVRNSTRELALEDLEAVAGGRGAAWDPNG